MINGQFAICETGEFMKRKTQVILRLCLALGMTSLMSLAHADTTIPVADFFKKAQTKKQPKGCFI